MYQILLLITRILHPHTLIQNTTGSDPFKYRGLEVGLLVTTVSVANKFRLGGFSV